MTTRHELLDEYRIEADVHRLIRRLLAEAFPEADFTATRDYLKQLPQQRLLAWRDQQLVGHMGLEHRVIGTQDGPATIFGIIDVCVAKDFQGQGIGSGMLQYIEDLGRTHGIDFLMLFATDGRVYARQGFKKADNSLRWLMIDEHKSLGMDEQPLEELHIKALSDRAWAAGTIDLLGYQF